MNTFRPKEGGRQKQEVVYRVFCLPGSLCDLHMTLCIRCREQLPALVTAAAPRHPVLQPQRLVAWIAGSDPAPGLPGCGMESAGW